MGVQSWKSSGAELALHLLRPRPLHSIVVTSSLRGDCTDFDTAAIYAEVQGWAEVIVVPSGRATYELRDNLPYGWEVFGTAARVYPIGISVDGIQPGKPHIVRPGDSIGQITTQVIDEVLFLPNPKSLVVPTAPTPGPGLRAAEPVRTIASHGVVSTATGSHPALVSGIVTGFRDNGFTADVALDTGKTAELKSEDIFAEAPLTWVLGEGTRLGGVYDPQNHQLSLRDSLTHPRLLQHYSWNQVVLCLVLEASAEYALLTPMPGEKITVRREDVSSNELDDVDSLLAPGQVVAARLVNDAGVRKLILVDVDDDEPVAPAPALVRGGIPWLALDRDFVPELSDSEQADPTLGMPLIPTPEKQRDALKQALLKIDALKSQVAVLRREADNGVLSELASALEQVAHYREEANRLRTLLKGKSEALNEAHKTARKKARSRDVVVASNMREKFLDDELALRHELYLEWVERVPANEKSDYPWSEKYTVGPKFTASFYAHDAALRAKTLKALTQLLTGRADRMNAREVHPKRIGMGGDDPQAVRDEDGATCWRMSVESGVAAARRVHYWKLPDGTIELHELVAHDTYVL